MSHPTLELKKAYLSLRRALDYAVRSFGLTSAQFEVLQLLMHNDGLEHRELQRRLAIASPTLSNIIDVLQRDGLVDRRVDPGDARTKTLHLSQRARALCSSDEFCSAGESLVKQMFAGFSAKQREEFMTALKRVELNLEAVST